MTIPQRGAAPGEAAGGARAGAVGRRRCGRARWPRSSDELHRVLDALTIRYEAQVKKAVGGDLGRARSRRSPGTSADDRLTYTDFVERADDRAIQVGFADAKKAFGADVAQSYVDHLAGDDDDDDACATRT